MCVILYVVLFDSIMTPVFNTKINMDEWMKNDWIVYIRKMLFQLFWFGDQW